MYYLATEARSGEVRSVLFLTPCHATPYYSALHQNVPMRFLDCTPRSELWDWFLLLHSSCDASLFQSDSPFTFS